MFYLILLIFFTGLFCFCSKMKHILIMLMVLEFMVVGLFLGIFWALSSSIFFFSLVFIVFTVCEGALGLALLVYISRVNGMEQINLFALN